MPTWPARGCYECPALGVALSSALIVSRIGSISQAEIHSALAHEPSNALRPRSTSDSLWFGENSTPVPSASPPNLPAVIPRVVPHRMADADAVADAELVLRLQRLCEPASAAETRQEPPAEQLAEAADAAAGPSEDAKAAWEAADREAVLAAQRRELEESAAAESARLERLLEAEERPAAELTASDEQAREREEELRSSLEGRLQQLEYDEEEFGALPPMSPAVRGARSFAGSQPASPGLRGTPRACPVVQNGNLIASIGNRFFCVLEPGI